MSANGGGLTHAKFSRFHGKKATDRDVDNDRKCWGKRWPDTRV